MSRKHNQQDQDDMLPEYDFTGAVRGKYYESYTKGREFVLRESDVSTAHLVFKDSGGVDAAKLGDLLFLFRGAYAAGLEAISSGLSKTEVDLERLLRIHLRNLDVQRVDSLFSKELGTDALITRSVQYSSPLEVGLSGVKEGIRAAVLLAGGNSEQFSKNTETRILMPTIEAAIQRLRSALVPGIRAPLGFGIRSRRVKLSKEELKELLRHDPSTEKRGGFQRFLIGLQSRVNRISGELYLSETEMNTILRHGRTPQKGGWQASIRQIFGRHFDFPPIQKKKKP